MKWMLASLMMIIGTTAHGGVLNIISCIPPNTCCLGELSVDAELLIWRSTDCEDDYALVPAGFVPNILPAPAKTRVFSVAPSFDLGLRVSAQYDQDCYFVDGRYIFFQSADFRQVDRPTAVIYAQGFLSNQPFFRASSRIRYGYQDANIRVGLACLNNKCCRLYSWLEGRYAQLKSKRTILAQQAQPPNETIFFSKSTGSFDGGGLGLGLGVQVQFLSCIRVSTELAAVGLVGARQNTYSRGGFNALVSNAFPTSYQTRSAFVPGVDLRAKVAYVNTYCGIGFRLFFAWEVNQYWNAQLINDPLIALNSAAPIQTLLGQIEGNRRCSSLGFGGPSVGFDISY